MLHKAPKTT